MGGVGQMLTFAYNVGGWGWQNAYVIIKVSSKRPNWPRRNWPWRKAAQVLDKYKYHWWQIVHSIRKNNSQSQFSPSKVGKTYFWIWDDNLSFIWWFRQFSINFCSKSRFFCVWHKLLFEQLILIKRAFQFRKSVTEWP